MPRIRSALLVVSALAAFSAPAAAQEVVPGLALDPSLVRPGAVRYTVTLVGGGQESPIGSFVEEIRFVEHGGRPAILRTSTFAGPEGAIVDSAVALRGTLAPVLHRSVQPSKRVAVEFDGSLVRATTTPAGGEPQARETQEIGPMFDSHHIELVLGSMPLREGATASLPFYVQEMGGRMEMSVRVGGVEAPPGIEGAAPAWKVSLSFPGAPATYWIDPDSRRVVLEEVRRGTGVIRIARVAGK